MIAAAIIQSAYNGLYKELRNYIWDYDTVVKIAELEAATYMAFPDLEKIRICASKLETELRASDVYDEDEALQAAMKTFDDQLEGADAVYYGLFVPQEITENQRNLEAMVEERRNKKQDMQVKEEIVDENSEVITENGETDIGTEE